MDSNTIKLLHTEDGSHTLYVPSIDETYHSTHGAVNESLHVYIHAGLELCPKQEVRVLEVGFGTGLNAYLAALNLKPKQTIYYTSVEKYPLQKNIWSSFNYAVIYGQNQPLFERLHLVPWNIVTELIPNFYLYKIRDDFSELILQDDFDVIFYDAFSPQKQPELWTELIFEKLFEHTKKSGILTTYCAKGSVRRALQSAGYYVERIPGPVGKREMLRATKQ